MRKPPPERVRPSKRPPGWEAPGPKPRGDQGEPDLQPADDEDLCHLSGDWRIFQKLDGHRWSLDDLATAHFAIVHAPPRVERLLDLGCGVGSVLMMMAWAFPQATAVGIEAQATSLALARRSLRYNGADDRVAVRSGDLRDPSLLPEGAVFDLVTGTPPYLPRGTGVESERVQCGPCRFEFRGGVEAYCEAAARALGPDGVFCLCEGSASVERVFAASAELGLSVFAWQAVVGREGKPPLFHLFALRRGAGLPRPAALPPLNVRNARHERGPEYLAIRTRLGLPP